MPLTGQLIKSGTKPRNVFFRRPMTGGTWHPPCFYRSA